MKLKTPELERPRGSAAKELRRQNAAKRFKIMKFISWSKAKKIGGHIDQVKPLYDAYVARKQIEAQALGIKINNSNEVIGKFGLMTSKNSEL